MLVRYSLVRKEYITVRGSHLPVKVEKLLVMIKS